MNKLPKQNQSSFLQNNNNMHYIHSQHSSRLYEQTHVSISRGLPEPTTLNNVDSLHQRHCPKITTHSKILNEKLKARAENSVFKCQTGLQKGRSCINRLA
jgi:hypothetical protein